MTENERLTIEEIIQHCKRQVQKIEKMFKKDHLENDDCGVADIIQKEYWEHRQVANYLEEIQAYRAIGTVEGYKRALEISKENFRVSMEYKAKVQKFESIGTIEEFKALKEKNTPKKGIPYTSSNNHKFVECPSCHKDMDLYYDFCQHCGQSVDWGKSKN